MKAKYYKHWAESELGEGVAFMEAVGDMIVRQVEIYGDEALWSDQRGQKDERFMLADQAPSAIDLRSEHEVTAEEFEAAWRKAHQCT
jgi:hypothetical protein